MAANDQYFYDLAAEEIRGNQMHQGLWLRAFSDTNGEPMKAHALYVKYRVETLKEQHQEQQRLRARQEQENASQQKVVAAQKIERLKEEKTVKNIIEKRLKKRGKGLQDLTLTERIFWAFVIFMVLCAVCFFASSH